MHVSVVACMWWCVHACVYVCVVACVWCVHCVWYVYVRVYMPACMCVCVCEIMEGRHIATETLGFLLQKEFILRSGKSEITAQVPLPK